MNNIWLPPPDITISDWADSNRQISPEASAEFGQWRTDRAPYQREIMNAISDESIERVIVMSSAQVGKTEIILNVIGYYVDKEPSPILVLQPTLEMGEAFSKDRLAPMIRDTPCLTGKIKDPRARDSGNTLLHKTFPGGHITIAGANSPAGLASRPIRILLCDEVDRYPESAGTEGDPVSLAIKRTQNFWNRKIVIVSTPTIKGISRIEKEYQSSSQEEWTLPCPECGKYNILSFDNLRYKDLFEPVMKCVHCGKEFNERQWKSGSLEGQWEVMNPEVENIRGFHLNALASPWVSWKSIISQYEEGKRKGSENMKVFVNTVLGSPYEVNESGINADELMSRCEEYKAELPDGVLVITAGVDVQDDRLECEVVGWGLGRESWSIDYKIIYGDPGQLTTWRELDDYVGRAWHYEDGESLLLSCVCIDSAGHYTDEVYRYCKDRTKRNIFAIVGRGTFGLPGVSNPSRTNRYKLPLFRLGVSTLKGILHQQLSINKPGPGYCHYPIDDVKYSEIYFRGILSESMVIKRLRGREVVTWEVKDKNVRNEPLDCRIYAMGALEIFNPDLEAHARRRDKDLERSSQVMKRMKEDKQAVKVKRVSSRMRVLKRGFRL